MKNLRKSTAAIVVSALIATPMALLTATPANAADREFRYAGAEVEFDVEREDGRYDIDVDVDDAKPGSRWRVVLRHNGKRIHKRVHRADRDGEFDIERTRPNTKGKDRFVLKIKRVGGPKAKKRVIVRR